MTKTLSALLATLLVASLGACGDDRGGGADPFSPDDPTSEQGERGNHQAPRLTAAPLDPTPFLTNPCALVDDETLAGLADLGPGDPDVDSEMARELTGPTCTWGKGDLSLTRATIAIRTVHQENAHPDSKGMDSVYGGYESGLADYLQPFEVEGHPGYPAAIYGEKKDIERGNCTADVGIRDDLTIAATMVDEENPSVACESAKKIAAAALTALKRGA